MLAIDHVEDFLKKHPTLNFCLKLNAKTKNWKIYQTSVFV